MAFLKDWIQRGLAARGYALTRIYPPDYEAEFRTFSEKIRVYTMTSLERQYALYRAVYYVLEAGIEGDMVECGVWRGGNIMLAMLTCLARKSKEKRFYLYDTFAGMSEPTEKDVNIHGKGATSKWHTLLRGKINEWDYASRAEVEKNIATVGYPEDKITIVEGKVEDTIPRTIPDKISLLRLDTDWYESTRHELEHLFPRLVPGGILIIDDYGHWQGAREAVDEYFKKQGIRFFLNRIDYTGRIGVKV